MTDPRIIECAKAMCALTGHIPDAMIEPNGVLQKTGKGYCGFGDGKEHAQWEFWIAEATACILKWLEVSTGNGFTWGMMAAGFNNLAGPADDRDKLCIGAAYQAMCEQAKKEIGGA